MPDRLAIIGASGFVGSALTEYALDHTDLIVTPFCHSTGGASRLAHRGLQTLQLDLLERVRVEAALQEFDYVVNCSRGNKRLMLDGLANLLEASRRAEVKKFIHLSSVAVYGDPPHPSSTSEDAPTEPASGSYGAVKLAQDEKVQRAASKGLNAVILCPPNIVGPYSDYLTDIIHSIETRRFRLLDGGEHPVNIVDVNNLSACVLCALTADVTDGHRWFVCEPSAITWRQFCKELTGVIRGDKEIPEISGDAYARMAVIASGRMSAKGRRGGALKHLMSDDVRSALRLHPVWAALEDTSKAGVRKLGKGVENRLRESFNGPLNVPIRRPVDNLDHALIAQQLRGVRHDPTRSYEKLRFTPPLSFTESMQSFRDWYVQHFEIDSPEWQLLGEAVKPNIRQDAG